MPWRKRKYDGDDDEDAPAKKEKPTWTTPRKQLDAHSGDTYWKLSNRKRLVISEWDGRILLHIREYYSKEGKMLPGKGVTLNMEQVGALILAFPEALEMLKEKRVELPDSESADGKEEGKQVVKAEKVHEHEDTHDDKHDDVDVVGVE